MAGERSCVVPFATGSPIFPCDCAAAAAPRRLLLGVKSIFPFNAAIVIIFHSLLDSFGFLVSHLPLEALQDAPAKKRAWDGMGWLATRMKEQA